MTKIIYIISQTIAYDKLICADAGPSYASSMNWEAVTLKDLNALDSENIYVIDNRISEQETIEFTQLFTSHPTVRFILKIVDPLFENFDHFYYIWVCKMIAFENVRLLSVYDSKELTYFISQVSNKDIIHAPYPYDQTKEVTLEKLSNRSNKIIISGTINSSIYPFRSSIWLNSRRNLSRLLFHVLKHPGYTELHNQDFKHGYTGENFIKYLSRYKYMLLCGSRCEIELLKFHECAYAGCLPVGECPTIYPKEIKDIFYPLTAKNIFFKVLKYLITWKALDHQEKITIYRNYLRTTRTAALVNQHILSKLKNENSFYSS